MPCAWLNPGRRKSDFSAKAAEAEKFMKSELEYSHAAPDGVKVLYQMKADIKYCGFELEP